VAQARENQFSATAVPRKEMVGDCAKSDQKTGVDNITPNQHQSAAGGFSQIYEGIIVQAIMMDEPNFLIGVTVSGKALVICLALVSAVSDKHRNRLRCRPKILEVRKEYRKEFSVTAQPGFISDHNRYV